MSGGDIKSKSIKGTAWSFVDNVFTVLFSFVIGVILARLLKPSDYGTVGVLSIFLSIANVFVDCGFGNAIIRKKDRTQADLSTAFYFNLAVSLIAYLILFFISPLVAYFFKMPILVIMLRILGLMVIFNGLSIIQNAQFTASLKIKTLMIINLATQIPMGLYGIYLAFKGFGVWTLVVQQVGTSFLRTLLLWIVSSWRPSLIFDKLSFDYLFNFGWKLLGASLIGTLFNEIYGFIIGRSMGADSLGFYSKSKLLAEKPRIIVQNVINKVILPIMVETQGNIDRIRLVYSRLIKLTSFLIFPLYFVLVLIAQPLIIVLWTDKWSETIILFQIFCVGFSLGPISQLNFCLLELLNRTDMTLKLEFVKKPLLIVILLLSIPFGVKGVVFGASIYNIIGSIINMYPTKKMLNYSYIKQIKDIVLYMFVASIPVVIFYFLPNIENIYISIFVFVLGYFVLYITLAYIFRCSALFDFLNLIIKKKCGKLL